MFSIQICCLCSKNPPTKAQLCQFYAPKHGQLYRKKCGNTGFKPSSPMTNDYMSIE